VIVVAHVLAVPVTELGHAAFEPLEGVGKLIRRIERTDGIDFLSVRSVFKAEKKNCGEPKKNHIASRGGNSIA
jgi:hypothetical protein